MGGGKGSSNMPDYSQQPEQKPAPPPQPAFTMPEVAMPAPAYTGPSYEEQLAQQRAEEERRRQEEERRRQEEERQRKIESRDDLYTSRLDAADTAVQFINDQIQKEQANANLLGIDYTITDEEKQKRINDYFATIWNEGDETKLSNLFEEVGKPDGFKDFTVVRGDPSAYEDQGSSEDVVSTTGKKKKRTLATDDEDNLGKTGEKLGGA